MSFMVATQLRVQRRRLLSSSLKESLNGGASFILGFTSEFLSSSECLKTICMEYHVIVGELIESKSSQQVGLNTPKAMATEINWNHDSDPSHDTGGYNITFSLTVLQSEFQQLICEILRATPEAASADATVQTARLAGKVPAKEKRDGSEDGLTFAFRFTDVSMSIPNQGMS